MDQISKAANPFSAAKLAKLPKHKAFVPAKGAAGKFTPGKRSAGPAEGPLTRRLTALQKNDTTVSAFGVDHAGEISKFNFGGAGAALGGATKKLGMNMKAGARAKQLKGMNGTGSGRLEGPELYLDGPGWSADQDCRALSVARPSRRARRWSVTR